MNLHLKLLSQIPSNFLLPYFHPIVLTHPSRKSYFLLILDIGPHHFVEWIYSKN